MSDPSRYRPPLAACLKRFRRAGGVLAVTAVLAAVAGRATGASLDIRFCANHRDHVELQLVRVPPNGDLPPPFILVAIPASTSGSIAGPVAGMVRVAGEARFRGIRLVSLAVDQTRPNLVSELGLPRRFRLEFDQPVPERAVSKSRPSPFMESLLRSLLLNYPYPDSYRAKQAAIPEGFSASRPIPAERETAVKIEVKGPGRVRIELDRLAELAGRRWTIDQARRQLRLWRNARPHAFAVGRDGAGEGEWLWFDAPPLGSRYTAWDVYWLTWSDPGSGPGSTDTPASPDEDPGLRPEWRTSLRRFDDGIRRPPQGADIIYICHPEFLGEIGPLIEWRRQQGLRVALVRSDEIADEFNFGRDEPEAIRRFLAWTSVHWPAPAPAFVVLVGDASAKPRESAPDVSRNFIGTFYGEGPDPPPHDDGFVKYTEDGRLPQMMLGRLSVNGPGQLAAIVEKLVAHEKQPRPGRWRGQLLLLADNGYERLFDDSITRYIPSHLDVPRIEVRDFPFVDHYNLENTKISPECEEAVVRRLSEGAAAVHYVGHGGVSLISHEKMLFWTDVARLKNSGKLPLFVQVSCRTGGFDWPEQEWNACLSEHLLRAPKAGALGVLSAARAIYGNEAYLQRLLFRVYRERRQLTLGEIKLAMKIPYLLNQPEVDFINSYNLLGDPASRQVFPAPFTRLSVEPRRVVLNGPVGIRFQAELPTTAPVAGEVQWRDPKGSLAGEPLRLSSNDGRLEGEIRLPDGAAPGQWTLIAYAAAKGSAEDFQQIATVEAVAPPVDYPDDPNGVTDLAFVSDKFEVIDQNPTDGDTIRVRAVVENRGTKRSSPARLIWSWAEAESDRKPTQVASSAVPALFPTERAPVVLRWDPTGVSGTISCALEIKPGGDEDAAGNNRAVQPLHILTKPDLTLAGTPVLERQDATLRVGLAVKNLGESAADLPGVRFSVGDEKGPRAPLAAAQEVAPRLEGGAVSPVRQWTFKLPPADPPFSHLYIEVLTARPVAEITKKNNRFRFEL